MTDGVERRAEIDTETVRSLQLLNGGTAVALSTMLPPLLQAGDLTQLSTAMLSAIGVCAFGLFCATVHNRLRRKCSLEYSKQKESREPPFKHSLFRSCQTVPGEPRICTKSIIWMWTSLACFVAAIVIIMIGGFSVVSHDRRDSSACWQLVPINQQVVRFNACTGVGDQYLAPVAASQNPPSPTAKVVASPAGVADVPVSAKK